MPFAGGVTYEMPKGKSIELRGQTFHGPLILARMNSQDYMDETLFPNANKMIPERWISGSDLEVSDRAKKCLKPFGAGRHICLGMSVAKLVLNLGMIAFAEDPKRRLDYDPTQVYPVPLPLPERCVKDGLPARLVTEP